MTIVQAGANCVEKHHRGDAFLFKKCEQSGQTTLSFGYARQWWWRFAAAGHAGRYR